MPKLVWHACAQDLIIPILKHPATFVYASPLVGHPPPDRDILFLFRGDVGAMRLPHYSRGIRQRLHRLARVRCWPRSLAAGQAMLVPSFQKAASPSRLARVSVGFF